MKKLAIIGAGGHARSVADIALAAGWSSVIFFDDAWKKIPKNGNWNVIGDTALLLSNLADFDGVVVALGSATERSQSQQRICDASGSLVTLIAPTAYVSDYAEIGSGSVILANAVVGAFARIGEGCIVNSGAVVEHDCDIGDFVHVASGATLSGGVSVGRFSWIGVGASVRQGEIIGENVVVGAGAVVVGHVPDGLTVVGCPAAPLRKG